MLIRLSPHTAISQLVAEVQLTGVAPGAVSHRSIYLFFQLGFRLNKIRFYSPQISFQEILNILREREKLFQDCMDIGFQANREFLSLTSLVFRSLEFSLGFPHRRIPFTVDYIFYSPRISVQKYWLYQIYNCDYVSAVGVRICLLTLGRSGPPIVSVVQKKTSYAI